MPDTTVRRPTLHPPQAPDGAYTLVWTVHLDPDQLAGNLPSITGRLAAEFHADVEQLLIRHQLQDFFARCRFSLADLRARDDRAAVATARRELMWQLRQIGIPAKRVAALLDRTVVEVVDGSQQHAADLQVAEARDEWTAA